MQFSGKFGVFTPPLEGSRPPSGKSWIRHWSVLFKHPIGQLSGFLLPLCSRQISSFIYKLCTRISRSIFQFQTKCIFTYRIINIYEWSWKYKSFIFQILSGLFYRFLQFFGCFLTIIECCSSVSDHSQWITSESHQQCCIIGSTNPCRITRKVEHTKYVLCTLKNLF